MDNLSPKITIFLDQSKFGSEHLPGFALRAYNLLSQWFGTPKNTSWKIGIYQGKYGGLGCDWIKKEYLISIPSKYVSTEQTCATVCHEMYHRVTHLRVGVAKVIWVDEMIATLATHHCLLQLGFPEYATMRMGLLTDSPVATLDVAHSFRRRRILPGIFGAGYPENYAASVAQLGMEIEQCVGWNKLVGLVTSQSWAVWLESLTHDERVSIERLLPSVDNYLP